MSSNNAGENEAINQSTGMFVPCVRDESWSTDESPCYKNADNIVPAQCSVVTLGTGDTGQLGLGPDVMAIATATRVPRLSDVVQVAVGGMHTVCLDVRGKVTLNCHAVFKQSTGCYGTNVLPSDALVVVGLVVIVVILRQQKLRDVHSGIDVKDYCQGHIGDGPRYS